MIIYVLIWVSVSGWFQSTINIDVPHVFNKAEDCVDKLQEIQKLNQGEGQCIKKEIE